MGPHSPLVTWRLPRVGPRETDPIGSENLDGLPTDLHPKLEWLANVCKDMLGEARKQRQGPQRMERAGAHQLCEATSG